MGITIDIGLESDLPVPPDGGPFTVAAMTQLGNLGIALIRLRTLRGIDASGKAFKGYSTRRIYIADDSETAMRLAPKGGVRTGESVRYDGGYREYKSLSRKAGGAKGGATSTAEVDLTLSGQLMRGIHVRDARYGEAVIAMSDAALYYGSAVHDKRPFMGLSPDDKRKLDAEAKRIVDAWMHDITRGRGALPPAPPRGLLGSAG